MNAKNRSPEKILEQLEVFFTETMKTYERALERSKGDTAYFFEWHGEQMVHNQLAKGLLDVLVRCRGNGLAPQATVNCFGKEAVSELFRPQMNSSSITANASALFRRNFYERVLELTLGSFGGAQYAINEKLFSNEKES